MKIAMIGQECVILTSIRQADRLHFWSKLDGFVQLEYSDIMIEGDDIEVLVLMDLLHSSDFRVVLGDFMTPQVHPNFIGFHPIHTMRCGQNVPV